MISGLSTRNIEESACEAVLIESVSNPSTLISMLGINTSLSSYCPYCPDHQLDPLGHHAVTCKGGGDVVLRHNSLRVSFHSSAIKGIWEDSWKWVVV